MSLAPVPIAELWIDKADIESVRAELAAKLPARAPVPVVSVPVAPPPPPRSPADKHAEMRASELIDLYVRTHGEGWAVSPLEEATRLCAPIVDLMGDPRIGDLERALERGYGAHMKKN